MITDDHSSANTLHCRDSAVTCLVMLARFHGLAAQPEQVRHQFGDADNGLEPVDLLRAAKSLKLKARRVRLSGKKRGEKIQDLPLPAVARHIDGHYFIIARIHEGKALVQDPLKDKPETVSLDVMETLFTGELFLFTRRSVLPGAMAQFDFSWFIPAILKHKKLIYEVLLASFFIQLFALVTDFWYKLSPL